jgi:adenylate cyclase
MTRFLTELKRRQVVRVALVYGATAFAILQAADLAFPRLGLPDWTVTFVLWLTILGLPVALVLSWVFELTPEGVRRTDADAPSSASTTWISTRTIALVIPGLIVAAMAGWLARGAGRPAGANLNSIAVLPFANLGGAQEDDYFSDGLAEELLNLLARIDGLKVSARTSSFAFKSKNLDVRAIGDSLDVGTVLEGSVRRDGETIRITAQLISVADGYHLWSDQFDARHTGIMQLQEQIARAIADALEIKLGRSELRARGTRNPQAHDSYLLGLAKWSERGPSPVRDALRYFEQAVAADSSYAQAWGGIALVNAVLPVWLRMDASLAAPRVREAAARAMRLDSTIAEPYAALCQSLAFNEWRWKEAEQACDAALARNPNFATAHQWRGELMSILGRHEESAASYANALDRDPRSMIAHILAAMGAAARHDTAATISTWAAARRLDRSGVTSVLGVPPLLGVGDTASARLQLTNRGIPADRIDLVITRLHDPAARAEVLRVLDMPAGRGTDLDRATNRALVGDYAGALDYLERSSAQREFNLPHALRNAFMAPLHSDPRFRAIVERMSLTPYFSEAK